MTSRNKLFLELIRPHFANAIAGIVETDALQKMRDKAELSCAGITPLA
jgi:hypothetical protein